MQPGDEIDQQGRRPGYRRGMCKCAPFCAAGRAEADSAAAAAEALPVLDGRQHRGRSPGRRPGPGCSGSPRTTRCPRCTQRCIATTFTCGVTPFSLS